MRLAAVVQHHPARAELLPPLLEQLAPLEPKVVCDPGAAEPKWSAWRCFEACLRALPAGASHLLIVQDDAELCRGFAAAALAALRAQPERIVAFYVGGRPASSARALCAASCQGESWVELDRSQWVPLVCAAFPRADVLELLAWAEGWKGPRRGDDNVVGEFVRKTGRQALATVPSLAQHPDVAPSLVGRRAGRGRDRGRVAACFIGEHDPAQIAW